MFRKKLIKYEVMMFLVLCLAQNSWLLLLYFCSAILDIGYEVINQGYKTDAPLVDKAPLEASGIDR